MNSDISHAMDSRKMHEKHHMFEGEHHHGYFHGKKASQLQEFPEANKNHSRHHEKRNLRAQQALDEIKRLGFELQYKALEERGYTDPKRNLKALVKSSGKVESAIEILDKKRPFNQKHKKNVANESAALATSQHEVLDDIALAKSQAQ